MDGVRKYIVSVICGAIICSIVNSLSSKKTANSAIIRLISGLFMALTLISPLLSIRLTDYSDYFSSFSADADSAAAYGESAAQDALRTIIKDRTEAYILDKAKSMDAELDVEVTLDDGNPPIPSGVMISGSISPYSKAVLGRFIANDLGIPEEDQVWT